ncbi:ATP-binding protein [Membranihabitans maritimus]|uniref:ATP-binding protein n=1 Tax=Membranihabitans maritimus TaxID=2904244 RepID=UPI001F425112|nr:ATP-binding protein [Membranihabitans maritimus]
MTELINGRAHVNSNTQYLWSDQLLLLVTAINNLRNEGVDVQINFIEFNHFSKSVNYASRLNFFKHLRVPYIEDFSRKNPIGRFTEIKKFDENNALQLQREIVQILISNGVNEDMLIVLDYCLWEVIDNTLNHAGPEYKYGNGYGYLCCQYFPAINEVRIMIADNGIGIHSSLTQHPDSKYQHLNEAQAVGSCIKKGISNSAGKGFGLWATAALIRENKGELIIHSGNYQLQCSSEEVIYETAYWKGTYVFLRLNTNMPVSYELIFDRSDQRNNFLDFKEEFLDELDSLW